MFVHPTYLRHVVAVADDEVAVYGPCLVPTMKLLTLNLASLVKCEPSLDDHPVVDAKEGENQIDVSQSNMQEVIMPVENRKKRKWVAEMDEPADISGEWEENSEAPPPEVAAVTTARGGDSGLHILKLGYPARNLDPAGVIEPVHRLRLPQQIREQRVPLRYTHASLLLRRFLPDPNITRTRTPPFQQTPQAPPQLRKRSSVRGGASRFQPPVRAARLRPPVNDPRENPD
nr:hypothetical protein Iba_chr13aCG10970 [Ipomoea batatas]